MLLKNHFFSDCPAGYLEKIRPLKTKPYRNLKPETH